jgi:sigma-70-like protein
MTPAQAAVVRLLSREELDYARIAERLSITVGTVQMHVEYVARWLPGHGPPAWRVLRHAEELLALTEADTAA